MLLALLLASSLANCGESSPCVSNPVDLQVIQHLTTQGNLTLLPSQPSTYFDGCNTCTCTGWGGCSCTTLACLHGTTLEAWPQPSKPASLSCSESLWKVIRESIDVLAGVKVRQSVVPTLRAAAEACE